MSRLADLLAFLVAFGVGLAIVALATGTVSGQPSLPFDEDGEVSTGNVSVAHSEYDDGRLTLVIENRGSESKNVTVRTLEGDFNDSVQVPADSHVVYEAGVDAGDRDEVAVLVSPEDGEGEVVEVPVTAPPEEDPVRLLASVAVLAVAFGIVAFVASRRRGSL